MILTTTTIIDESGLHCAKTFRPNSWIEDGDLRWLIMGTHGFTYQMIIESLNRMMRFHEFRSGRNKKYIEVYFFSYRKNCRFKKKSEKSLKFITFIKYNHQIWMSTNQMDVTYFFKWKTQLLLPLILVKYLWIEIW